MRKLSSTVIVGLGSASEEGVAPVASDHVIPAKSPDTAERPTAQTRGPSDIPAAVGSFPAVQCADVQRIDFALPKKSQTDEQLDQQLRVLVAENERLGSQVICKLITIVSVSFS